MVQFRLGRISVRIHAAFVFTVLLLGIGTKQLSTYAVWCAVACASVFLHELGHALAGMAYGLVPRIELVGLGGQTTFPRFRSLGQAALGDVMRRLRPFESSVRSRPGREMVISLAGPAITLLIFVAAGVAERVLAGRGASPALVEAMHVASAANFVWGVFNLLPVLPLDGGRVMTAVLVALKVRDAERRAMAASIAFGVGLAGLFLVQHIYFAAVLMLLFGWRNFQARAVTGALRTEADLVVELAQARSALEARDGHAMMAVAESVLARSRTREVRAEALRMLAYGQFLEGHWSSLLRLVDQLGDEIGPSELQKLADAAAEVGRSDEANHIRSRAAATAGSTAQ